LRNQCEKRHKGIGDLETKSPGPAVTGTGPDAPREREEPRRCLILTGWPGKKKGAYIVLDWNKLEDLSTEAKQLANMAETIADATAYSANTGGAYLDTINLLEKLLTAHAAKLETMFKDTLVDVKAARAAKEAGAQQQ
jgi:hypothetical protein